MYELFTRSKTFVNNLIRLFQQLFSNRLIRLFIQILVLVFCGAYLFRNYREIQSVLGKLTINYSQIGISLSLTTAAIFFGVFGWWMTLLAVGDRLDIWDTTRAHLYSNIAKYLPGYGWQLFGKAYLTHQQGVEASSVGMSMVLELFLLMSTGVLTSVISFPMNINISWLPYWLNNNLGIIRWIIGVLACAGPYVAGRILIGIGKKRNHNNISVQRIYMAFFGMLFGWWINGLAFWILGNALANISTAYILEFIFILSIAFITGFLVFIVPGSFGIREGVIIILLTPLTGQPLALTIAVVIRIIQICSDLLGVAFFRIANLIRVYPSSRA